MSGRVAIVACTPAWNEPPGLLERCALSVRDVCDRHHVYAGGIARLTGGQWATQAEMRDAGRAWAQRHGRSVLGIGGAVWLLQLDADETLVNGEQLRPLLERWPWPAYPLPLVQEDGQTTLAPFKLIRLPARIVACSEYVRFRGDATTWNLAGYGCPPELRAALLELPFLFHTPGLRGFYGSAPIRAGARLSLEELHVEQRPANAVQWPIPPLTLTRRRTTMAKLDDDGTFREHEASDGDYACPGCGARYDTPGVCEGPSSESRHEPISVEAVKDSSAAGGSGGPSKDELRARAAELGLELSKKATKDEIAAAIAEHEKAGAPA